MDGRSMCVCVGSQTCTSTTHTPSPLCPLETVREVEPEQDYIILLIMEQKVESSA